MTITAAPPPERRRRRARHPNAAAAGGSTGAAVLVVWLAGHLGVDISNEAAVAIAGAATTAVLFVGRVGVAGTVRRLVHGDGQG